MRSPLDRLNRPIHEAALLALAWPILRLAQWVADGEPDEGDDDE